MIENINIRKNTFFKNVLTLITGAAVAQALNIIIAPILSRLYDPHAFGVFAVYTSIVSICVVVVGLKYELAIVLPKRQEDAANVLCLSIIVNVFMTLLSTIILLLFKDNLKIWFHIQGLNQFIWWVPISILFFGICDGFNYWSTRQKSFKRLSVSQVFRSISVAVIQLGGGISKIGAVGLIAGQAIGNMVATVALGKQIWKDDRQVLKSSFNFNKIKDLARTYKEFPKYSALQALVNSISQNAISFILAAYFSPTTVGYYALSLRLLQLPINLIGESVRQVFYPKAAELYNEGGDLRKYFIKSTLFLGVIIAIPTLLIFLFGPPLFSLVLGKQWIEAGIYARWMMLWLFFVFITRPTVVLFQILKLQKAFLLIETIGFVIKTLLLLMISKIWNNAPLSILVYSISNVLFYIASLIFILQKTKKI
ncbi:lipopolysaccharide biosynthesis protein [Geobacillus thermoleovorans]|uniref:lipopolysaccharide biosynthesis protein n=1 Tax=Geobacillus thermoleovorans TaxID=33941 RepID=UPI003D1A6435